MNVKTSHSTVFMQYQAYFDKSLQTSPAKCIIKTLSMGVKPCRQKRKAGEKALARGLLEKAAENAELMIHSFVGSLVDLSEYTVICDMRETEEIQ